MSALSVHAAPVAAQTAPEGIDWYVLNELNRFYLDIDDPTNRPALMAVVPEGVLVPVEVNGDGQTDWLIQWPDSTQFCGTGGCRRTLYISGPGGSYFRALDRQALELTINPGEAEVRVEGWLHHLNCQDARTECRFAWVWDAQARRLVGRAASDGTAAPKDGPILVDPAWEEE
ncbi:MAG: hypothetical protein ACK4FG_08045 [Brevundimonas sp.]